ncbi:MAG: hypothetical protein AAF404_11090 [Pseudomonadota bacterium]
MYLDKAIGVALCTLAILWMVLYFSRGNLSVGARTVIIVILLFATSLCTALIFRAIPISGFDLF